MKTIILALTIALSLATAKEPHISYVYPAGGQSGEMVEVFIAGQNLRSPQAVYISDNSAKPFIIEYVPVLRPLKDDDRIAFKKRLSVLQKELRENGNDPLTDEEIEKLKENVETYPKGSRLNHPMLRELETLNSTELRSVSQMALGAVRPDPQLAEGISVKLNIKANTRPGMYQVRLLTSSGLSNPINFQIDKLPELNEREPNDQESYIEPVATPVVFNGQIMPGDVDRLSFSAKKGQKLVVEVQARSLKPYLADAVPGWFQAVLSVLDSKGKEIAYCDDYRFNPDPVIFFEAPEDGTYQVQLYDSIYRGREDFVYRISVAQRPFIKSIFPLGTQAGKSTEAELDGWNLPQTKLKLNPKGSGRSGIKYARLNVENLFSNKATYSIDKMPDCIERSDTTMLSPQKVVLPIIINGRIEKNKESDYFSFEGSKGQQVVIEINARSLNSPLDAAIELVDAKGKVVAFNDDYKNRALGLQTHHSDPYLMTTLAEDGLFTVRLFDVTGAFGTEYSYRLRISEPIPTYELRMTPSNIALPPGESAAVKIDVLSKDGFNDEILLGLKSRPKAAYKLGGGKIPAGKDSIYITITSPDNLKNASELVIESRAKTKNGIINKTATPAENMMQAFIYYQLVPSQELLSTPKKTKWKMPAFDISNKEMKLTAGSRTTLTFTNRNPGNLKDKQMEVSLLTETDKLKISNVKSSQKTVTFTVEVAKNCPVGYRDNIVAKLAMIVSRKDKKDQIEKYTTELNSLPAVSIEIVDKDNKDTK